MYNKLLLKKKQPTVVFRVYTNCHSDVKLFSHILEESQNTSAFKGYVDFWKSYSTLTELAVLAYLYNYTLLNHFLSTNNIIICG